MPVFGSGEGGNRWLMRTMARECHRRAVTAVHAYEDCSLWQFVEARRLGKSCIYDLPMSYYAAWEKTQAELFREYPDWVPSGRRSAADDRRLEQKRQEIELADLTLVASRYVEATIREFYPYKEVARAPYGVDLQFWTPGQKNKSKLPLRFIYAGHLSLRKGVPFLIEAWSKADLRDAELVLVGSWALAEGKRQFWPKGITWLPPCSPQALRNQFQRSDVFVFPSFAEGFGLVLLEAMACGLPAIATESSIGPEVVTPGCGFVIAPGNLDQLVEILRWFHRHQDQVPAMGLAARNQAERWTWANYRNLVTRAVSSFV
jgi:glycosyltransferase involved in cell wall biosynthesis